MTELPIFASSKTDEWLTPPDIIARLAAVATIVLDPCSHPLSHVNASNTCDLRNGHDGLALDWYPVWTSGLVYQVYPPIIFVNPPYSDLAVWLAKCADEAARGAHVVALVPARIESRAFQDHVLGQADLYAFRGRLVFERDIHIEYEAELAKAKPRASRLQAIEDAAAAGVLVWPSDSATFPSVLIQWWPNGLTPPAAYTAVRVAFPDGDGGRWIR